MLNLYGDFIDQNCDSHNCEPGQTLWLDRELLLSSQVTPKLRDFNKIHFIVLWFLWTRLLLNLGFVIFRTDSSINLIVLSALFVEARGTASKFEQVRRIAFVRLATAKWCTGTGVAPAWPPLIGETSFVGTDLIMSIDTHSSFDRVSELTLFLWLECHWAQCRSPLNSLWLSMAICWQQSKVYIVNALYMNTYRYCL